MRRFAFACWVALASTLLFAFAACDRDVTPRADATAPKPAAHFFTINVGDKPVRMQLAVSDVEQERGLMFRRDLGTDEGMLFVYARPQAMSFWMRNTPTPLDIGFFDTDGVLREVYPMQPFDESPVRSRSSAIKFPLEMNQGWFSQNGIKPGAQLDLQALATALKERGFDPRKYGL